MNVFLLILMIGSGVAAADIPNPSAPSYPISPYPTTGTIYSSPAQDLSAWAEVIRARGDYFGAIAKARLDEAQALYWRAQAASEFQRARELEQFVNRFELELKRLRHDEYEARKRIATIENSARSLKPLNIGRTSSYVFSSLRFFWMQVIPPAALGDAMKTKVDALSATDFSPNGHGADAEGFSGGNVGKLFSFIEQKNYSLVAWSDAHFAILTCLGVLGAAAEAQIAQLRAYLRELRDGTLSIWSPPLASPAPRPPGA
ncbi:MAG: hypothetical protein HY537_15110 [Deltaproteobacteria bacterium]|nr:hypothetical protein [Deltaproteobacteria bacterium]